MRARSLAAKLLLRCALVLLALALITLPPSIGLLSTGERPAPYLQFPLTPHSLALPGFSWPIFGGYALAIGLTLAPFLIRLASGPPSTYRASRSRSFPWWGWLGAGLLLAAWMLAWNAIPTAPSIRRHTFTGLWLGFIVLASAMTLRRCGHCLLTDAPGRLLALFPASAVFWWLFEYLNQYIGNWHYVQLNASSPGMVDLFSSLPFSTVLPAVITTRDLLATFPGLSRGLDQWWQPPRPSRLLALPALGLAMAALAMMAVYPSWFFPVIWLAPLIVITAVQILAGERSLLTPLAQGDWAVPWLAALAGLVCGFFWELWNWQSLARWSYSLAYVDRFHVFAMPLLGYSGYLPFGMTCVAAAQLFTGMDATPFVVKPAYDGDRSR